MGGRHAESAGVPAEYVRRQTLAGTERYVTAELKDYETKVLGAEERRRRLEHQLFEDVRGRVAAEARSLLTTARALALLDVLAGPPGGAQIGRASGRGRGGIPVVAGSF